MLTRALTAPILLLATVGALCRTPKVQEIIRRSVAANQADWTADPEYAHKERDRNADGTKTYEVTMIDGSPYQRLIAVNGNPLPAQDQAKEQRKLQETISRRRAESKRQRDERIAKYEKDRRRDRLLMEQLTVAFDFTLVNEAKLGPYDVYVLRAAPRKGYRPPNMESARIDRIINRERSPRRTSRKYSGSILPLNRPKRPLTSCRGRD
ncbi:MAG: hypothetical protein ACR2I2_14665 [Bryobacteraceae bacterium]